MADPAMHSTSAASPSAASPDTSSPTLPTLPSPSAPDVPSSPSPGHLTTSSPRAVENPPPTRAEIVDNTSADSPASSPPSAAHDSDATTSAIVLSPIGQLVESDRLKRKRSESVATSVATGLKEEDASDDEEGEEERESSAAETSGPSALAMAAVFEDERGFKLVDIVGVEILLDHLLSWPLRKKGAKVVGLIDPSLKRRLDSCPEVPGVEGAHQLFHRYPIQIKSLVDLLKWAV